MYAVKQARYHAYVMNGSTGLAFGLPSSLLLNPFFHTFFFPPPRYTQGPNCHLTQDGRANNHLTLTLRPISDSPYSWQVAQHSLALAFDIVL